MIALPALSSGVDRLQDWFFLVNEPEQLFPHYLLEASLQKIVIFRAYTLLSSCCSSFTYHETSFKEQITLIFKFF